MSQEPALNKLVSDPVAANRVERIKVWDLPTRVFHWLLVVSFTGAWLTRESVRWHDVHLMFGYTVGGLILFRIVWGFTGSYYARFSSFDCAPGRVLAYLGALLRNKPEHHAGHSPAGAAMALLFLGLGLFIFGSGIAAEREIGGETLAGFHAMAAKAMLALVGLHVLALVLSAVVLRIDLVRPMFTGRKLGLHSERIGRWRTGVGIALLLVVSAYWSADRAGLLGEDGKSRRPLIERR
jgi:cytochrome b